MVMVTGTHHNNARTFAAPRYRHTGQQTKAVSRKISIGCVGMRVVLDQSVPDFFAGKEIGIARINKPKRQAVDQSMA